MRDWLARIWKVLLARFGAMPVAAATSDAPVQPDAKPSAGLAPPESTALIPTVIAGEPDLQLLIADAEPAAAPTAQTVLVAENLPGQASLVTDSVERIDATESEVQPVVAAGSDTPAAVLATGFASAGPAAGGEPIKLATQAHTEPYAPVLQTIGTDSVSVSGADDVLPLIAILASPEAARLAGLPAADATQSTYQAEAAREPDASEQLPPRSLLADFSAARREGGVDVADMQEGELDCKPLDEAKNALADDTVASALPASLPTAPPRYQPRLRARAGSAAPIARASRPQGRGIGALDAELLIFFQPGGWGIAISILLRRGADGPEEVAVRTGEGVINAVAIDETFFEPLPLLSIEDALRNGLAIETADTPRRRWVRTQRTLHVFSQRSGVPGFASVPRVVIGQENVILCTGEVSGAVLDFCRTTGAEALVEVMGPGVFPGWRCFRGYRPKRPAPQEAAEEFLLALNPMPDAAIELSGGISIRRATWIPDRPPTIRVIGDEAADSSVTIDGEIAVSDGDGWTSPGWNALGRHVVHYAGLSRSYEIEACEEHWESWNAHPGDQFSACGAAVADLSGIRSVVLRAPGCWLLGALPGEVAWAAPSAYGSVAAAPMFEPVWAVFPRRGRTLAPPRLLAPGVRPAKPLPGTQQSAVRRWRQLLRNSQARLEEGYANALWQEYRRAAHALKERKRR